MDRKRGGGRGKETERENLRLKPIMALKMLFKKNVLFIIFIHHLIYCQLDSHINTY
jgi:hypothetical protein